MLNPNSAWAQQADLWLTPYGFLQAAASNNAMAMSHTMGGKKYTMVSFTAPSKAKVNGYINADNMVERVETWIDNPDARRHAFRGDLYRLQGFRRREISDAHRAEAGRLSRRWT